MTIYQRMLFHAGVLRAPEAGAGAGGGGAPPATSVFGAGAGGQQTPPANGDAGAGGQQTPPANGNAPDWFAKLSGDAEMKAWAESKGWKDATAADPFAIAQSYYNLEKLFGADKAGRTVQLPKDANDKAALDAIYDKLGRPKDASGYEIALPDGADTGFADTAKGWFHKAGLTKDQAKAVTESYRAMELDAAQKVETQHAQQVEALQQEWGGQFAQRVETAKAATKAAGLTEQHVKAIEMAIGPASAAKLFEFFGRNYVEAGPPGNEQRGNPSFSSVTPASAKQKMDALRADPNFMSRYNSADPKVRAGAIQEMDDLAKVAVNLKA
ncbi:MAG: hypothetical protein ABFD65_14025 [Candidatus Polarisedimenticolia bacterium]